LNKTKKEDLKKVGWFIVIGLIIALFGIIIRESVAEIVPSEGTFLGLPFNPADFVFVLILIVGSALMFIFLKNYRKEINKSRKLH